jgi:hypothetical protein
MALAPLAVRWPGAARHRFLTRLAVLSQSGVSRFSGLPPRSGNTRQTVEQSHTII